ncbi:ABC transporter ATP-binding protein [Lederbergia sp. NSJ-179]|uniref:ABC transporter ATP-binding protein n=1 Tax=Lederbergia sp. NSJ-179 TaxID=2931402 RepID=UPI001FD5B383|nr:ABC transporter ATP-binding protein [Lederbergia sp. NSJ-179]MCJ7840051.1 ABC transporter ATP-binding protein [Lederbergia sp. NSJ-179]
MNTILSAVNLHKKYRKENNMNVLNNINLTVNKGTITVIMGTSGSGKTTLLSTIGGLNQPTKGSVYFRQQDIFSLNDKRLAKLRGRHFGFIYQSYNLIHELTVYDNIILPLYITKQKMNEQKILGLIDSLGLMSVKNNFPTELSGGQQQRVAIARAMIHQPDIIFADEPTGNLDSKNSRNVVDILQKLCHQHDKTLILVTHDKDLVRNPDQLLCIKDGQIIKG